MRDWWWYIVQRNICDWNCEEVFHIPPILWTKRIGWKAHANLKCPPSIINLYMLVVTTIKISMQWLFSIWSYELSKLLNWICVEAPFSLTLLHISKLPLCFCQILYILQKNSQSTQFYPELYIKMIIIIFALFPFYNLNLAKKVAWKYLSWPCQNLVFGFPMHILHYK